MKNDVCPICGNKIKNKKNKTCSKDCSYRYRVIIIKQNNGEDYYKNLSKKMKQSPLATSQFQIEYWVKRGYSEEDAKKQISLIQKKISQASIERYLNKGYSLEEAKKMQSAYQKKSSKCCIEYWINKGMSEEDSILEVSKHQKRDLQFFVNKYGKEKGLENYNKKNILIKENCAFSYDYWIKQGFSHEKAIQAILDIGKKSICGKKRTEFENSLVKYLEKLNINFTRNFLVTCTEANFNIAPNKYYIECDYLLLDLNIVIEMDGSYWHGGNSCRDEQLKQYRIAVDNEKRNFLFEKYNFKVLVIHEDDLVNDINTVLEEISCELKKLQK